MKPFPWRAGMRSLAGTALRHDVTVIAVDGEMASIGTVIDGNTRVDWVRVSKLTPDLTDAATLGALEGAVQEAWGDTGIHMAPFAIVEGVYGWVPRRGSGGLLLGAGAPYESKGAALLAAWEAPP